MQSGSKKTLSPRDLAEALGVSQSSIKRWVDAGLISVYRTAGGHRRIAITEAVRFVREKNMRVVRPELFGIPGGDAATETPAREPDAQTLFELLVQHRIQDARNTALGWYLSGHSLGTIFDGPVAETLATVGELWKDQDDGIYREHLVTSAVIELIGQLRGLLAEVPVYAPRALGGAVENDPYVIPSQMAACIFRAAGYSDLNLGANTPSRSFLSAVQNAQPEIVWLTVKSPVRSAARAHSICQLASDLLQKGTDVIVGGRAIYKLTDMPPRVQVVEDMRSLENYLASRKSAGTPRR